MLVKTMLHILIFFYLILSSIFIHEFIHAFQILSSGDDVDEICFLGWKRFNNTDAIGWTKSIVKKEYKKGELEFDAYIIQFIYLIFGGILLSVWKERNTLFK